VEDIPTIKILIDRLADMFGFVFRCEETHQPSPSLHFSSAMHKFPVFPPCIPSSYPFQPLISTLRSTNSFSVNERPSDIYLLEFSPGCVSINSVKWHSPTPLTAPPRLTRGTDNKKH
jgi:hypothetical protein